VLKIGLDMDRERLYEWINSRVDVMIAAGLVEEVRELHGKGCAHYETRHAPFCQTSAVLVPGGQGNRVVHAGGHQHLVSNDRKLSGNR
jgi:tRNA A37 N6-isopentenylltransferase MiaA